MMKRVFSLAAMIVCFTCIAMGQTTFEQSQSRIIEPKQDVFIKPLVAEIKILNNEARQDFGPYEFDIPSIDALTFDQLDNFKTRSLYKAARESNADIIVAATFNARSDAKGKKIIIEVSGFPGKYVNFRTATEADGDYKWITTVYPIGDRTIDTGKTKALKGK